MGNFSTPGRYYPGSTFDPQKGYVGVRLQQGIPLVDADWNELNDVVRDEVYKSFNLISKDGVPLRTPNTSGNDFGVFVEIPFFGIPYAGDNDFYVLPGQALIQGRYVNVPEPQRLEELIRYSTQPWTDSRRADEDGVDVVPSLTTPTDARTDIVYLDTWEREVDSIEDSDLVNSAIGIETCVRLKREVTIRVAEGTTDLPTAPDGHAFMPLALLKREAGQASLSEKNIEDIRPRLSSSYGIHRVSLLPMFLPSTEPWQISTSIELRGELFVQLTLLNKIYAQKKAGEFASGLLPLNLPNGSRIRTILFNGFTEGRLVVELIRGNSQFENLANFSNIRDVQRRSGDVIGEAIFEREASLSYRTLREDSITILPQNRQRRLDIVDNNRFHYYLSISHDGDGKAEIQGILLEYNDY